jgi:hypothetical protein
VGSYRAWATRDFHTDGVKLTRALAGAWLSGLDLEGFAQKRRLALSMLEV